MKEIIVGGRTSEELKYLFVNGLRIGIEDAGAAVNLLIEMYFGQFLIIQERAKEYSVFRKPIVFKDYSPTSLVHFYF